MPTKSTKPPTLSLPLDLQPWLEPPLKGRGRAWSIPVLAPYERLGSSTLRGAGRPSHEFDPRLNPWLPTDFAHIAADTAQRHRSGWELYDPVHDPATPRRLALAADLREALEGDGLDVCFQPLWFFLAADEDDVDFVAAIARAERVLELRLPRDGRAVDFNNRVASPQARLVRRRAGLRRGDLGRQGVHVSSLE